ncbi:hypothetical protein [Microbacterium sp. NPDC086615]|jgi:hypothetical protein|uniref:hypothetical protein n=1 Tax=Microbacterium sp. NPDC086615 TaxID=3154865 RepID=UPI0034442092|nr:hypothetical protein [Microbacterium sp.]
MTRFDSPESAFVSPLTPDWTIADVLEWIAASDDRCHDERLLGILDAVDRALHPSSARAATRVVVHVRALAARVAADPSVGERVLGELVPVRDRETSAVAEGEVLVPA